MSGNPTVGELDLDSLHSYLSEQQVPLAGPLSAELISGGRSNLTFLVTDGASNWVLRRPPEGLVLAGAHDVGREHRVMSALAGTAVPVPAVVAACEDDHVLGVPFYVMDRIDGTVLRSRELVAELDVPTRHRLSENLVDTLAELHAVDYAAVGLAELGRGAGYLQRQVDRWARQYVKIKVRELDHVDTIVSVLTATMPTSSAVSIVHGDYRIDNVIVSATDPARIAGVLDWEMATLGDPLADLGMLLMFWDEQGKPFNPITGGLTAFDGFFSQDEVVERYVGRRGLQIDDIDWYLAFSQFKLAIILEQIHARFLAGQTPGEGFENIGGMVTVLLQSTMDTINASASLSR